MLEEELIDEDLEIDREPIVYEIGDQVVYPHHGAGKVLKKEQKEVLGEKREYLTIQILHNDMTVMVPCENAGRAGLRRVIGVRIPLMTLAPASSPRRATAIRSARACATHGARAVGRTRGG